MRNEEAQYPSIRHYERDADGLFGDRIKIGGVNLDLGISSFELILTLPFNLENLYSLNREIERYLMEQVEEKYRHRRRNGEVEIENPAFCDVETYYYESNTDRVQTITIAGKKPTEEAIRREMDRMIEDMHEVGYID